jgi:hypothetical protein
MSLYVQKYALSMEVEKVVIFYKDYFLYGNIPQSEVEMIHTYLIGSYSDSRDGYIPTWMDYGLQGHTKKCLRKQIRSANRGSVTESDLEDEKLGDTELQFSQLNDKHSENPDNKYTEF